MGRPRKDQSVDEVEVQVEAEDNTGNTVVNEPVFDKIGLAIVRDPKTGYSFVVEIPINDLMQVGKPKVIGEPMEMDIARERFRIEAGNRIL